MKLVFLIPPVVLRSFSSDYVYTATATSLLKSILTRLFKLCRDCFNSLEMPNVGEFPMKLNSWGSHPSLDRERKIRRPVC